ncbi:hypothetical protein CCP3SC1AL1_110044 [Gammaproteobacteria bacterium]
MSVRELQIKIGEEVSINGHLFPVLLDEVEILEAAEQLQAEAKAIEQTPAGIRSFANKIIAFLERTLGDGAVAKIAGGKKIGVVNLLALVSLITRDIAKSYADTLSEYAPTK